MLHVNRAIDSIAAKRLVNRVLHLRKLYAGSLLRSIRSITKIVIAEKGDIGESLHCAHSEPFFYESAYQFVDRPDSMSIDECGRYRPFLSIHHIPLPHACTILGFVLGIIMLLCLA